MVKRRNLSPDFEAGMSDLLRRLGDSAVRSSTVPHGVKHLGVTGDTVWVAGDGRVTSVRAVDEGLEAARARIDEAEGSLAESQVRLDEAERTVEEARVRLDSVQSVILLSHGDGRQGRADASEAWGFDTTDAPPGAEGSWSVTAAQNSGYPLFPGVEERWAIPVDPAREYLITYWTKNSVTGGLHAGQATRYDAGGAVLGTFFLSTNRASGTEWTKHELTITPAQLDGAARLGFTMYGNVGANRGAFKTGGWSLQAKVGARQVEASEELSTLVVTDSAILNHATLIGQTVVDDINVQGKLIGTDGVFTGTVDFENINVEDSVLAERISGEHLYGTIIEGGSLEASSDDGLTVFISGTAVPWSNPISPGLVPYPGMAFTAPGGTGLVGVIGASPIGAGDANVDFGGIGSVRLDILNSSGESAGGSVAASPNGSSLNGPPQLGSSYTASVSATYTGATLTAGDTGPSSSAGSVFASSSMLYLRGGSVQSEYRTSFMAVPRTGSGYGASLFAEQGSIGPTGGGSGYEVVLAKNYGKLSPEGRAGYGLDMSESGIDVMYWEPTPGGGMSGETIGPLHTFGVGPWQSISLVNGWLPYTGGGGYYPGARARAVPGGVQIQAMVRSGAKGNIGLLPANLRPLHATFLTAQTPGGVPGQVFVSLAGGGQAIAYNAGPDAPAYLAFDAILPLT